MLYPMSAATDVIPSLAERLVHSPRELSMSPSVGIDPEMVGIDSRGGETLAAVTVMYRGGDKDDEPLREIRSMHKPILDTIGPVSFVDWQRQYDILSAYGTGWYTKGGHTKTLSPELVAQMYQNTVEHREVGDPAVPHKVFGWISIGGAANDVADADSAYSGRQAQWHCAFEVPFASREKGERIIDWAREAWKKTELVLDMSTSYVNTSGDEVGPVENIYGAEKLQRLRAVKTTYDPTNFFHLNNNIPPLDT